MCEHAPAALIRTAGPKPIDQRSRPLKSPIFSEHCKGCRSLHLAQIIPQLGQPGLEAACVVWETLIPKVLTTIGLSGGFQALRRALRNWAFRNHPRSHRCETGGRGGAAFPTGQKWNAVRVNPQPRYLVCNADESEPGTFKDRVILEGDPYALVEAMTIAAHATGCEQGYLYIRGEYSLAARRMEHAIRQCRSRGFLGENILGHEIKFDIEVRIGAGAYICGEETALLNSIEGYRGEPRNKPPFPTQVGLFGRPTVINNVETLVNVLPILLEGGEAFSRSAQDNPPARNCSAFPGTLCPRACTKQISGLHCASCSISQAASPAPDGCKQF